MSGSVQVVALPHALRLDRVTFDLDAGRTIDDTLVEIIKRTEIDPRALQRAHVVINDRAVPKALWPIIRAKAGTQVAVRVVPGDGFGSLFVQIAGLAAAAFVPALGLSKIATFALKAAITVGASLGAQALAPTHRGPVRLPDGPAPEAKRSIQGTQNQARPYGSIPVIYGRLVNYHPPLAAQPYTEIIGSASDQYLRMLLTCGEGPVDMSDIKVGTTPTSGFSDFIVVTRDGSGGSTTRTFPSQVREEPLSIQLKKAGGYSQRRTQPSTDEIFVDITFPNGLQRISASNAKHAMGVQFQMQYRKVGNTTWLAAPVEKSSGAVVIDGGGLFTIRGQLKSAVRSDLRVVFPTRDQYDVRLKRVTVDDQSDIGDGATYITTEDSWWTSIRSFTNEDPINRTGVSIIALRAKASDELNGVIQTLNLTVERRLPVWNGSTWSTQKTRNPAWAFVDVATGSANARAISTDRVDLDTMLEWANYCDAEGLTFDAAIEDAVPVRDLLQEIAATGNAILTYSNHKYSVVVDKPRTTIAQHFSPRNSWGFTGVRYFGDFPHALKVRFPNEATLHQFDEIIVYDDGYTEANATKFEVVDLPFTTKATTAWKVGRWKIAAAKLRAELFSIETDVEHVRCEVGDLVRFTHDVPLIGLGSARVTAVNTSGSDTVSVSVDAPMPMESGKSYSARFRLSSGASLLLPITTVDGEQSTLTFETPIASSEAAPAVGDLLAAFGESGSESIECLIRSIEPRPDLSAAITMIPYAPGVYTAADGEIPPHDPVITLPPELSRVTPAKPSLLSVVSDEGAGYVSNNGAVFPQIELAFSVNPNAGAVPVTALQVQWRLVAQFVDGTLLTDLPFEQVTLEPGAQSYTITPVETGQIYDIRLRAVGPAGATSSWVTHTETVIGLVEPPPDIDHIFRQGDFISWSYPDPSSDFAGFRVRANYGSNTNWQQARDLHSGNLSESRFDISSLDGTQTILVVAVDVAGNVSENPAIVTINLGDPLTSNLILTQSEDPSFAGTITNASVISNELNADVDGDPMFWGENSSLFWGSDGDTFWPTVTYKAATYTATYDPVANHIGATIKLALTVAGDFSVDYREVDSPTFWGSDGSTFWGSDGDLFWAASTVSEWNTWPGLLGPLNSDDTTFEFRITTAASNVRGVISNFDVLVDVPDIIEAIEDFAVADTDTVRLPITKTYRVIKSVNYTVQNAGGPRVVDQLDKNATSGPSIEVLNATTGARVAETIDATVIGY